MSAPERFARLCWGPTVDSTAHPYGLIAGGLADGSVCIWNPARIIGQPADSKGAQLARLSKHTGGPVRGLEFNPTCPNLLASGGADGELCIWDIANPSQPSLYPAMKASGAPGPQPEITALAWNRKVQHIIATATAHGTVIVWDLKKQRPIISFKDPNGARRVSAVAWNPEVATQLVVASDDDACPSLALWDLRNSVSPLMELRGHTRGILGISWCTQDPTLLITTAKDYRTIVWDMAAGQPYSEAPTGTNWSFDVQWSPDHGAGLYASATFEGQVTLSTLALCAVVNQYGTDVGKGKAPSWLKRPSSVALGFGGRVACLSNTKRQMPSGELVEAGSVIIKQVVTEPDLVSGTEAFEEAVRGGDRDALRAFCEKRAASATNAAEAETWTFLQTHFESDGRRFLLEKLGFSDVLQTSVPTEEISDLSLQAKSPQADGLGTHADADADAFFDNADAGAFFDNLGSQPPRDAASPIAAGKVQRPPVSQQASLNAPREQDGTPGKDEEGIQRALLVGNYPGAVDACLKVGRFADALVIASLTGGDVWNKACKAFMKAEPRPYMKLVRAAVEGDWQTFVQSRPIRGWRETMAALLTTAPADEFDTLLNSLALKLTSAGENHASTLCRIAAGDVESVISEWSKGSLTPGAPINVLQSLLERSLVLGLGTGKAGGSEALAGLAATYAEMLASNGCMTAALDFLHMLPDGDPGGAVSMLKDRVYKAGGAETVAETAAAPPPSNASYHPSYSAAEGNGYGAYPNAPVAHGFTSYGGGGGGGGGGQQFPQVAPPAPPPPAQYAPPAQVYQPAVAVPSAPSAPTTYQQFQPSEPAPPPTALFQQSSGHGTPANNTLAFQQQPPSPPRAAVAPPQVFQHAPGIQASHVASPLANQPPTMAPPPPPPPHVFQPAQGPSPALSMPTRPTHALQPFSDPGGASSSTMTYQHQQPLSPPATATAPPPQVFQHATLPPNQPPIGAPPPPPGHVFHPGGTSTSSFAPPGGIAQPASPGYSAVPPPIAPKPVPSKPAGPPASISISTVDTSRVPADLKPAVASLLNLFKTCEVACSNNPTKQRELEDSSKKLGTLFWKLSEGQVSPSVGGKLKQLAVALDSGDLVGATHVQVSLTTSDWDECSGWLTALKRLIKTRQTM